MRTKKLKVTQIEIEPHYKKGFRYMTIHFNDNTTGFTSISTSLLAKFKKRNKHLKWIDLTKKNLCSS